MNISISEILVVLLIALLVIKPNQLPEVAHALGRLMNYMWQLINKVKADMHNIVHTVDKPNEQKRES